MIITIIIIIIIIIIITLLPDTFQRRARDEHQAHRSGQQLLL